MGLGFEVKGLAVCFIPWQPMLRRVIDCSESNSSRSHDGLVVNLS